jgi:hypothetical protein
VSALRLLRTIRLDPSDAFVFERAAVPGEWAVTGSFLFDEVAPDSLGPKARAAFRSGFLGIDSFGFSTLAVVTEASEAERDAAVDQLAAQFVARLGAPDIASARAAAAEEIAFVASLCAHPPNTLVALARRVVEGELVEQFRTFLPRNDGPKGGWRAFDVEKFAEDGDTAAEPVDLRGLTGLEGKGRAR